MPRALLTVGNPKTLKNASHGYLTVAQHLAPARLSGREFCPHSSAGCRAACFYWSGRGLLLRTQQARIRRSQDFSADPAAFMGRLRNELAEYVDQAAQAGVRLAARLNATSDIPWENVRCGKFANIFECFPDVVFYDYTKTPIHLRRRALELPNYHLTFSLSEDNDLDAIRALRVGVNVAVVFDRVLPARYWGLEVVNGDEHDLRFADPSPCIVGLTAKGRLGRSDDSGFVKRARPRPTTGGSYAHLRSPAHPRGLHRARAPRHLRRRGS